MQHPYTYIDAFLYTRRLYIWDEDRSKFSVRRWNGGEEKPNRCGSQSSSDVMANGSFPLCYSFFFCQVFCHRWHTHTDPYVIFLFVERCFYSYLFFYFFKITFSLVRNAMRFPLNRRELFHLFGCSLSYYYLFYIISCSVSSDIRKCNQNMQKEKKEKEKCFQPFQLLNRFRVRVLTLNTLRVDLFDFKSVSWILTARAAAAAPWQNSLGFPPSQKMFTTFPCKFIYYWTRKTVFFSSSFFRLLE
jgi:hypothetical protein